MGIFNATPDSFHASSRYNTAIFNSGADIIDIGAESTRPGYKPVPAAEPGKMGIFGKEPVARMNGLGSRQNRRRPNGHQHVNPAFHFSSYKNITRKMNYKCDKP